LPISEVEHFSGFGGLVAKVFRRDGEGVDDIVAVLDPRRGAVKVHQQPLVWVEVEGIGEFKSIDEVAILWAHERGTSIGSVDVHPNVVSVRDLAQFSERIVRSRGRRSNGRDEIAWDESSGLICKKGLLQSLRFQGQRVGVGFKNSHVRCMYACNHRGLLRTRVSLIGDVNHQLGSGIRVVRQVKALEGAILRRHQIHQHHLRRSTLDHTTASFRLGTQKGTREATHLTKPVHHHNLKLSTRRRGHPHHALYTQTGTQHIAQDGRKTRVGTEKGKEVGALPMGDVGYDDSIHIRLDRFPTLSFCTPNASIEEITEVRNVSRKREIRYTEGGTEGDESVAQTVSSKDFGILHGQWLLRTYGSLLREHLDHILWLSF